MPDLFEELIRELRLECLDEPRRRLTGRIRDDVELDRDDAWAGAAMPEERIEMVDVTISARTDADLTRRLGRCGPAHRRSRPPLRFAAGDGAPKLPASASVRPTPQTHQLAPRSERSRGITHLAGDLREIAHETESVADVE